MEGGKRSPGAPVLYLEDGSTWGYVVDGALEGPVEPCGRWIT